MGTSSDPPDRELISRQQGHADTIPARESEASEPALAPTVRRSTPTMPPPSPEDRYQIGAELGRGGMGRVVEALDVALGRKVALKEVLPRAGGAGSRRFQREVALTARLEHPSIVPLYDAGTMPDGRPYYVMRRVSGRPLDEIITRTRTLDERIVYLPAIQSAIDAVAHAHRRGVIHRDLKPANIIVGELGETVVIDWGLAKVIGEEDENASRDSLPSDSLQTQMGQVFGTPGFMAPEQARGEDLGPQGDVYALGATLYQLLSGTPPHSGKSATEVLDKTLRHSMIPLPKIAPGVPPELVTIVNKALAAEPEHRYPHAGALGEDLRRFLAGQLVAAHRYTTSERFMRFARKHRATLAVAALALTALAALAWLSVARIMSERDAANEARAQAIAEKAAAETANKKLAERHDALLVSRARARIDQNATEALATLKQLPANSTQLGEARAVAQAAVLRGVTWGMQSTLEFSIITELSPDGKQLLQVSRDGMVRIWDLERRRLELQRPFSNLTRAVWLTGGKLFVTHASSPAVILDPKTNTLETTTVPAVEIAFASAMGERVVFEGESGAGIFDAATRGVIMLSTAKIHDIALSPDGQLFAWTEDKATVVADATGKELARMPLRAVRIEVSGARTVAVLHDNKLSEIQLDGPQPRIVPIVPPGGETKDILIDIKYRERELVVLTSRVAFWGWNGKETYQRGTAGSMSGGMRTADGDFIVMLSADNKVHFLDGRMHGSVQMPANLRRPRLVAGPQSSQVLVVSDGLILGFDLQAIRPRILRVTPDTLAEFVDDETLIIGTMDGWAWLDIASGTRTPIAHDNFGPIDVRDVESAGRVLVHEDGPRGTRVILLKKGSAEAKVIVEAPGAWGRLVPGNGLVYASGDARVMAIVDDEPPRELVKLQGAADGAVALGHGQIGIHSSAGELVRANLRTGQLDRTTVALGRQFLMAGEASGKVVIAEDTRVLLWDGVVTQLASFDKAIVDLAPLQGVVAVVLRDHETHLVELRPNMPTRRIFQASRFRPLASHDGALLVAIGNADQIEVVELPSRVRWSVPPFYKMLSPGARVSPTKRRVLQHAHDRVLVWTLPYAPAADFAGWLDEHTNANVDGDGALLWPWQAPGAKP